MKIWSQPLHAPALLLVAVLAQGCVTFREQRSSVLKSRAAFDLKCPEAQLVITPLDDAARTHGGGTTGVSGCDRQATYLWDAQTGTWVMNSVPPPG